MLLEQVARREEVTRNFRKLCNENLRFIKHYLSDKIKENVVGWAGLGMF
jgi:hypothetical protein